MNRMKGKIRASFLVLASLIVVGLASCGNGTFVRKSDNERFANSRVKHPLTVDEAEFIKIVKNVRLSFVEIQVARVTKYDADGKPSAYGIYRKVGSGFFYSGGQGRRVLTAKHVVDDVDSKYQVLAHDGAIHKVTDLFLADDKSVVMADVAILVLGDAPYGKYPGLELRSKNPEIGSFAFAFGAPLDYSFVASYGIVSQYTEITYGMGDPYFMALGFTANIAPGNSGGPVVGSDGKLIGIAVAMDTRYAGFYFAIPVDIVKRFTYGR
jgi:S1-C subfamily serine protease